MLKSLLFCGREFQVIIGATIGLAKKFLLFLSKIKNTFFIFIKNFIEQHIHHFAPLLTAIFRQLHNSIVPKLLIFSSKELFKCLLQSSRAWTFFSLREFSKDQSKWKFEGAMSGGYGTWIRTSQPSYNSFCLIIKETLGLALILLEDNGFYVD